MERKLLPIEIADALNTFYVNIGKSVEQKIPKGNFLTIYVTEIFLTLFSTPVHMRKSVNIYRTFPLFLNPQDQIAFHPLF